MREARARRQCRVSKNTMPFGAAYESAIDPHYRELYCDEYVKLAPSTTGDRRAETGHLIAVVDLMPNSWASPQGEAKKCNVHDRTVMMNALAIEEAGACKRAAT
jgi:hypothetical protein